MQSDQQKREIHNLETLLALETEKLLDFKQSIERDKQARQLVTRDIFNNERETKFYQDNLKRIDVDKINTELSDLKVELISCKQERIKNLRRALAGFDGIESSNESLKIRIEELKRSRLSLDMSFDDMS